MRVRLVDADADHSAQEYMAYCRVALACHPERSEGSPTRQCAVNAVISGGLSAIIYPYNPHFWKIPFIFLSLHT